VSWIDPRCVHALWLRETRKFFRSRSRLIGSVSMPFFFLAFLGLGIRPMAPANLPGGVPYLQYLVPGILGMTMLFSSMAAGMSVLWDREFGFLKEIMAAPVSRLSIVLGRTAGGLTTALLQGALILLAALPLGFRPAGPAGLAAAIPILALLSATFIGLGLAFASRMKDIQGYSLVWNFVIFPLFFLSGALYPLENLPLWLRVLGRLDPLTYGVDALRHVLAGHGAYPLGADLALLAGSASAMMALGALLFERSESVA
jgi:ABC-2 type transport system permease protein